MRKRLKKSFDYLSDSSKKYISLIPLSHVFDCTTQNFADKWGISKNGNPNPSAVAIAEIIKFGDVKFNEIKSLPQIIKLLKEY